jgi:hypothetical protein
MRTTVDIPDATYRQLKSRAASEGTTVKALVVMGVEAVLRTTKKPPRKRLKLPLIPGPPGSIDIDNERIYDIIGFP